MIYFKHYTNMRHDIKIKRLMRRYGIKGYGLYNLILESIADALESSKPIPDLEDTAQDIAEQYHDNTTDINEMMAFMIQQGLFNLDEITGRIVCHKIYKFLDKSQTRSPEIRAMIEAYKKTKLLTMSETIPDKSDIGISRSISKGIGIEEHKERFTPPTSDEVQDYLTEKKHTSFTGQSFCDFYASRGWMIGKYKMKDWKAAVRTWIARDKEKNPEVPSLEERVKRAKEMYG